MDITPIRPSYDAVIVGARCAGAAVAMRLAQHGLRVLAIDKRAYGADALSTHALMRAGVYLLNQWGISEILEAEGTPRIERTSFDYGDDRIELDIKPRDGVSCLYAPRRDVLDRVLADAARAAGAELRFGVSLEGLMRTGGRVTGVVVRGADGVVREIDAGIVVGADGRTSTVAGMVGARAYRVGRYRTATLFGYFDGPTVAGNEWAYRPGIGTGAVPTNRGQTLLFVGMPPAQLGEELRDGVDAGFWRLFRETEPGLAARMEGARLDKSYRRFNGAVGHMRHSYGPGWALVGDAGYFKDPITAHGITDAFRDAELLSRAIAAGGDGALAAYQDERDAVSQRLFDITDRIASCQWDMDELKQLHIELSKEMNRETDALSTLAPTGAYTSEPQSVLRRN